MINSMQNLSNIDLRLHDGAIIAQKRAMPVQVEFATSAGILQTREGAVAYKKGDALVTGSFDDRWPVSRDRFERTYTPASKVAMGDDGTYIKIANQVNALLFTEPFSIELSDRKGTLVGGAGDWLIQYSPGDYGVVASDIFDQTYLPTHPENGGPI